MTFSYYATNVRSVSWVTFENVTQYLYVKEASDKLKKGIRWDFEPLSVWNFRDPYLKYSLEQQIIPADTELWIEPQNKTDIRFTHHAVFNVEAGKTYEYFVGSDTQTTDSFEFSTADQDRDRIFK